MNEMTEAFVTKWNTCEDCRRQREMFMLGFTSNIATVIVVALALWVYRKTK